MLELRGEPGATFLINAPYPTDEVWDKLARPVQQEIIDKQLKVYVIDARKVAQAAGMGGRINTDHAGLPLRPVRHPAQGRSHRLYQEGHQKTYGRKSQAVVEKNFAAVDQALAHLSD